MALFGEPVSPAEVCANDEPVPAGLPTRPCFVDLDDANGEYSLPVESLFVVDAGFVPTSFETMGRTLESKQQIVAELRQLLDQSDLALVLDYKGLSVKEMADLRSRLRASTAVCKVTKNTLMRRAIAADRLWQGLDPLLSGTNAFVLVKGDVGGAIKAVQAFRKDAKKSEIKGGLLEGQLLSDAEIQAIGDLPSKEALMAKIAGSLNGLATKVAVGIKEVPAGLARSLQCVASGEGSSSGAN